MRFKVGYTQGTFDMFHIGHLNLINNTKKYCDYLIVGVNADSLVQEYKHKTPVIPELDRQAIVANIKAVDKCVIAYTLDKVEMWKQYHFDAIFIGDDWKGNDRWTKTEEELKPLGVCVVYLPYTNDISSTILRTEKNNRVSE